MTQQFTKEEIKALKEIAQDKILFTKTFLSDEKGERIPYRNRFETWDDTYHNLKKLGFSHDDIIKQIGKKEQKIK